MSMGNSLGNTSPLAATQSGANTPAASMGMSTALSGLSLGNSGVLGNGNSGTLPNGNSGLSLGQSGVLMTSETVAPCLKGANRNKAKVREVHSCRPSPRCCVESSHLPGFD